MTIIETLFESIVLIVHRREPSHSLFHCLKIFIVLLLFEFIFLLRNFSFPRWFQSSWVFAACWRRSFLESALHVLWILTAPWILTKSLVLKIHGRRSNRLWNWSSVASTCFSLAKTPRPTVAFFGLEHRFQITDFVKFKRFSCARLFRFDLLKWPWRRLFLVL